MSEPRVVDRSGPQPNFEVYKARRAPRTYLVVSTSAVRRGSDPPRHQQEFEARPDIDSLARELEEAFETSGGVPVPVTLKVHGFNTRRADFEREVLTDAEPALCYHWRGRRDLPAGFDADAETFRPDNRFYLGFRWPSEGMFSRGSLRDTAIALVRSPVVGVYLVLLPLLALLWAGCLQGSLERGLPVVGRATRILVEAGLWLQTLLDQQSPPLAALLRVLFTPYLEVCLAATLLGAGLLMLVLRLSTYLRDRYRALHYAVPDLGEFMRALEERLHPAGVQLKLDVIGHSMGTLVLINAFRVMSDYFHSYGAEGPPAGTLGRDGTFQLGTLMLCAADIPAVMATPDRNNYFLSALRRFRSVHVFTSDRDIILKWLSSLANWASEPRYDMSGRKLGNVLLVRARPPRLESPDSRAEWTLWPVTRPVFRSYHLYGQDPINTVRRPADLHFHDCTRDPSVGGGEGFAIAATFLLLVVLGGVGLVWARGILRWLFVMVALLFGLGLISRPAWPWLRDRGALGGLAGFFTEWPILVMFLAPWIGWNPHGGYFMSRHAPRQRMSAILRDPAQYPRRDAQGREIEELDELIRYRLVRLSV